MLGKFLTAAALTLSLASAGAAATIDIDPQNSGSVFKDRKGKNDWHITVGRSVGTGKDVRWGSVEAGLFRLTEDVPNGIDRDFVAFCLSPGVWLNLDVDYTRGTMLSPGIIANLGLLASQVFGDVDSDITAGAFQLAVWELATDDDFSLSRRGGNFRAWANHDKDAAEALVLAQGWLDAIRDGVWMNTGETRLSFFKAQGKSQDLLAIAPVPLPAAGLLLIGAFGGLALLRKRKATAA
jgi:hypothetical protein